jgi:predicted RNase H-like nuclease (RuvC/YqgF family)
MDTLGLINSENKGTRTKLDNDVEELNTEIYSLKRELSKYKPSQDLQTYIDDKAKRLDNRVSLLEQD